MAGDGGEDSDGEAGQRGDVPAEERAGHGDARVRDAKAGTLDRHRRGRIGRKSHACATEGKSR